MGRHKHWTAEEDKILTYRLNVLKETLEEAAMYLNCNAEQVRSRARRIGIRGKAQKPLRKYSDEDRALMREMHRDGKTWWQIGQHFGVSGESARCAAHWIGRTAVQQNIIEQLFAAIPKDTRGLTARLCGDPLPGRSALDRRQHA